MPFTCTKFSSHLSTTLNRAIISEWYFTVHPVINLFLIYFVIFQWRCGEKSDTTLILASLASLFTLMFFCEVRILNQEKCIKVYYGYTSLRRSLCMSFCLSSHLSDTNGFLMISCINGIYGKLEEWYHFIGQELCSYLQNIYWKYGYNNSSFLVISYFNLSF